MLPLPTVIISTPIYESCEGLPRSRPPLLRVLGFGARSGRVCGREDGKVRWLTGDRDVKAKKALHSIIPSIKVEASSSLRTSLLYKETEPTRHTAVSPTLTEAQAQSSPPGFGLQVQGGGKGRRCLHAKEDHENYKLRQRDVPETDTIKD